MNKVFRYGCVVLCFAAIMFCVACGNIKNNDGINIITTNFPAYDFARQMAGDYANIEMLIEPGSDSHTYEPTPQDIIAINESDIFIYVGGENDSWMDGILETIENDNLIMIKMMDCVTVYEEEYVEGMEKDEHDHEEGDEHKEEWDEHIWTSPINADKICNTIKNKLVEIDATNKSYYESRYEEYKNKLNELDEAFKNIVNTSDKNTLIFADRFPARYFVEEYGLEYYAAFPGCSSDSEASASTIAFLIDKVIDEDISTILKIELSKGNIAETIKEETSAEVLTFYACHNLTKSDFDNGKTYLDFMWENVKTLEKALK